MSRFLVSLFLLAGLGFALTGLPHPRRGHAVLGEQMAATAAPTSDAGEEALFHWARLPVRIFLATDDPSKQEWARTAVAGFDEWVQATRGVVSYRLVSSPSQAQITVRFVSTATIPSRPDLVGLTTTNWVGPVLQSADIVLATGGKSPSDLQTAAAHEFGHALGIRGHSQDPDDLMFHAPIRVPTPLAHPVTQRDLDTLKRCYPALFAS